MTYANLSPLANHLWQSTIFVTALFLLTLAFRKNRAAVRYWVWLAASIKFLIPFSVLISVGHQLEWRPISTIAKPQVTKVLNEVSQPFAVSSEGSAVTAVPISPSYTLTGVLFVWLGGAIVGLAFWVRLQRRMHAVVRASTPLHVKFPVPVLSSLTRVEPGVFGIWKPVLVLPAGIADVLTPVQLEGILAHELCHVRRRDNLTAAIHNVAEVIFWFHPMVWWIRTQLVKEREQACDEAVLQGGNQPRVYAEAILDVCKFYLEAQPLCVSGVTGANLRRRIEAILTNHTGQRLNRSKKLLLAGAAFAALAAPLVIGLSYGESQNDGRSEASFAVASVKPSEQSAWPRVRLGPMPGGQGYEARNIAVRFMIERVYNLVDNQISGGPGWMNTERYDIEAKAERPSSIEELHKMFQNLLADRFKLQFHRETRELPLFDLVVDKNGPKLGMPGTPLKVATPT